MKTAVSQSSLHAHDSMAVTGFAELQSRILACMAPGKLYSRRELAKLAGLETSTTAGRCHELLAIGAIEACGVIRCRVTNRHVHGLKRADEQLELL